MLKKLKTNSRLSEYDSHSFHYNSTFNQTITFFDTPILLVLFAVCYNAILAFVNAHVLSIGKVHVASTEILIVSFAIVWSLRKNINSTKTWLSYLIYVFVIFIYMYGFSYLSGNQTSVKPLRDMLIICSFGMLGTTISGQYEYARKIFSALSICVIFFLLLENYALDLFVEIFEITKYYLNTRTVSLEFQNRAEQANGLFFTAGSFDGRFTLGFRTDQRLSSIFLEPTTHANFGILTVIFLMTFWDNLTKPQRLLFATTTLLIVLGTDSRQLIAMICILVSIKLVGIYRVPRLTLLAYMPVALLVMTIFFYDPYAVKTDNISGRLTHSANTLLSTPFTALLGGHQGVTVIDSGYTYFLYAHSLLGMIIFWLLLSFVPAYSTKDQRYFAHAIMMFFTINLAVSGSTIFSIKTAALLWFLVGILRRPFDDQKQTLLNPL